jgi:alkylation response protein AidB-like acyl-CoA dehydrogenase
VRLVRSAEQQAFGAALHDLLGGSGGGGGAGGDVTGRAAREWAAGDRAGGLALWRDLAGLGVTALAVPEHRGGLGATALDLVVACEEAGHHALPGPVAESLAAVPHLLDELGDDPRVAAWLGGLAKGDLIATVAVPPRLPYAADAGAAGLVLLAEGEAVWVAEPGARHRSVDGTRELSEVSGGELLADGPRAGAATRAALRWGALASAAQLLGAGRALLEASVRHARQREQFGRPIGAFQAVQHQLADVAIALEFARPLLDGAAVSVDAVSVDAVSVDVGGRAVDRDVSAAKVACADAAHRAARVALQVHGAIGYTQEHDLGLWLTKVRALLPLWGTQAEHRAAILAALTSAGNEEMFALPGCGRRQ